MRSQPGGSSGPASRAGEESSRDAGTAAVETEGVPAVAGVPLSASINAWSASASAATSSSRPVGDGRNRAEGLFECRLAFRSHGLDRTCGPGPLPLPGSRDWLSARRPSTSSLCCAVQPPVGLRHRRTA